MVLRLLIIALVSALALSALSAAGGLNAQFDARGLSSLAYNGEELLVKGPAGISAAAVDADGKPVNINDGSDQSCQVLGNAFIRTYPGLTVITVFTQEKDTLHMTVTFRNTGAGAISRVTFRPFTLQFPKRPMGGVWKWGYRVSTNNDGEPGVVEADWGVSKVLACVDEIERPVTFGFDGNYGNSTQNTIIIETAKGDSLKAGAEKTFRFSLRFAPSTTSSNDMVKDIYAQFARAYPYKLNWPDRRPIGAIMLCLSATNWPTNPRGWFADPKLDITTEAGRADFHDRMMKYADQCIREMKSVGAQGMIFWSVEGEQMPHATTYLGDPRILPQSAPEMDAVADEFFKKFRDAGLRTGVCIRPSRIIPDGKGGWKHLQVPDSTAEMADKITYAKKRWGCTIFYMDTNVRWERGMWDGDSWLLPSRDLHELTRLHPDVLIFPEFGRVGYWGCCMPYTELRGGGTGTRSSIRAIYPRSGTTVNTADGDFAGNWSSLLAGVAAGDIHLFRGWFPDPGNQQVKNLYQEADYLRRGATVKLTGTLEQRLAQQDPLVRYQALRQLETPTAEQAALIAKLLPAEPDWVVKKKMVEVLGASGQAAVVPALIDVLKDAKSNLDGFVAPALGRIGPAATEALLQLAAGNDQRLTEQALNALGCYEDPKALPALLELTKSPAQSVSRLAIRALGNQHDPTAAVRLVELLAGDKPEIIIEACASLGRLKDRTAVKPLVETIERSVKELKNNNVRSAAGDALEAITGLEYGPYEQRWRKALNEGKI